MSYDDDGWDVKYANTGMAIGAGSQAHATALPQEAPPSAVEAATPSKQEEYQPLSSRGAQSWDQTVQDFKSIGSIAAGFVPGVGEAMDVKAAYDAYQQGDYIDAGVNALAAGVGAFPVVGDVARLGVKGAAKGASKVADWFNPMSGSTADKLATTKDYAFSGNILEGVGADDDGWGTPSTESAFDPTFDASSPAGQADRAANSWDDDGDNDHGAFSGGATFSSSGWGAGREADDDWDDEEGGSWQDVPDVAPTPAAPAPQQDNNDDNDDDWSAGTGWSNSSNSGWGNSAGGEFDTSPAPSNNNNDDGGGGGGGK